MLEKFLIQKKLPFFETGFPTLDRLLGGGIVVGSLTIIAGGAGTGKNSFLKRIVDSQHKAHWFKQLNTNDNMLVMWKGHMGTVGYSGVRPDNWKFTGTIGPENKKTAVVITVPVNRNSITFGNIMECFSCLSEFTLQSSCAIILKWHSEFVTASLVKNRYDSTGERKLGQFRIKFGFDMGAYECSDF
jgi:hypothetical protein